VARSLIVIPALKKASNIAIPEDVRMRGCVPGKRINEPQENLT